MKFWSFAVNLTLNTAIKYFQDTLTYYNKPSNSNYVWLQTDMHFSRSRWNSHILMTWALTVTLIWNTAKKSFHMTFQLTTMHHPTKFSSKGSAVQMISSRQTLTETMNLHCNLDNNPVLSKDTLVDDDLPSN